MWSSEADATSQAVFRTGMRTFVEGILKDLRAARTAAMTAAAIALAGVSVGPASLLAIPGERVQTDSDKIVAIQGQILDRLAEIERSLKAVEKKIEDGGSGGKAAASRPVPSLPVS